MILLEARRLQDLFFPFLLTMISGCNRLHGMVQSGELSVYSCGVTISMIERVMIKLTKGFKSIQEKVGGLMGGEVMELEFIKKWEDYEEKSKKAQMVDEIQEENAHLKEELAFLKKEISKLQANMA